MKENGSAGRKKCEDERGGETKSASVFGAQLLVAVKGWGLGGGFKPGLTGSRDLELLRDFSREGISNSLPRPTPASLLCLLKRGR